MAHPDNSPFSDPERGSDQQRSPFPRWEQRLAEARALLTWAPAEDERRPEGEPDR